MEIGFLLSTHPMTSDRISEVSGLIARFPDKQEYQITSSEFNAVKSRLISQVAAQRGTAAGNNRPTLKRRPSSANDNGASDQETSDRPAPKRGDPAATESSGQPQESTGRPTLKRRGDAGADPNNES